VICGFISGNVSSDFFLPVSFVILRHAQMPPATVPKAAIYKYGESMATKQKIRFSGQRLMPSPPFDAISPKDGDQF
jgi:hypothetical protein